MQVVDPLAQTQMVIDYLFQAGVEVGDDADAITDAAQRAQGFEGAGFEYPVGLAFAEGVDEADRIGAMGDAEQGKHLAIVFPIEAAPLFPCMRIHRAVGQHQIDRLVGAGDGFWADSDIADALDVVGDDVLAMWLEPR